MVAEEGKEGWGGMAAGAACDTWWHGRALQCF